MKIVINERHNYFSKAISKINTLGTPCFFMHHKIVTKKIHRTRGDKYLVPWNKSTVENH